MSIKKFHQNKIEEIDSCERDNLQVLQMNLASLWWSWNFSSDYKTILKEHIKQGTFRWQYLDTPSNTKLC